MRGGRAATVPAAKEEMYTVKFKETYSNGQRPINEESPEIVFMREACKGSVRASDYFDDYTVYRQKVFLDSPNGRFEGVAGIQDFADRWLDDFEATGATVYPVIQTVANGRSVTEMEVWFELSGGGVKRVPMVVFADLVNASRMEGMRIYFFFKFLKNCIAYRKPIFRPGRNHWCEPVLMTGVMRYYYEQLHNFRTEEAVENIVAMCSEGIYYGGYRPEEEEPLYQGRDAVRNIYADICTKCPGDQYVRFETFTDDNLNMAVEWTTVVRQSALAKGYVSFGGCAMYGRDDEGLLSSIRICDNFGYEMGIDLNSVPASEIFVD